jgi:hypothetical protein
MGVIRKLKRKLGIIKDEEISQLLDVGNNYWKNNDFTNAIKTFQ